MAYPTAAQIRDAVGEPIASDDDTYPDALLTQLVAEFADIAERFRGVAFVPTTTVEEREVDGCSLFLDWARPRSITSLVVDGDTLDPSSYQLNKSTGQLRFRAGSSSGNNGFPSLAVVTYIHGEDDLPSPIYRGCLEYVRATAVSDRSGTGRDVIAQTFDGGFTRYSTPDWEAGRPTGWLEVDRLLNSVSDRRTPAGIA